MWRGLNWRNAETLYGRRRDREGLYSWRDRSSGRTAWELLPPAVGVRTVLWTFEGLHAARHLYEKSGFQLVEQYRGTQWGTEVNEQQFLLQLQ